MPWLYRSLMMLEKSMAGLRCVAVTMARRRSVLVGGLRVLSFRPPRPLEGVGLVEGVLFYWRTEMSWLMWKRDV